MGRPKEHNEETRIRLRDAAEQLVAEGGADALSVRTVATKAGTTTRAVYSLFGSKEGLLGALAQRAYELLEAAIREIPEASDPANDLIEVGVRYRRFVLAHPALFRIAFQRIVPELQMGPEAAAARARASRPFRAILQRLKDAGLLKRKGVPVAAVEFGAMCEGLANFELRGGTTLSPPNGGEERVWRDALRTVIRGFNSRG